MTTTDDDDGTCHGHTAEEYDETVREAIAEGDLDRARLALAHFAYYFPTDDRVALGVLLVENAARDPESP